MEVAYKTICNLVFEVLFKFISELVKVKLIERLETSFKLV